MDGPILRFGAAKGRPPGESNIAGKKVHGELGTDRTGGWEGAMGAKTDPKVLRPPIRR